MNAGIAMAIAMAIAVVWPGLLSSKAAAIPKGSCTDHPAHAQLLLQVGRKLGIAVRQGSPELEGKDASYRALHGRPGVITIKPRPMAPAVRCQLITHEFIHVLQHFGARLRGVEPLGWPLSPGERSRFGSLQEAEAYAYQNQPALVWQLLEAHRLDPTRPK